MTEEAVTTAGPDSTLRTGRLRVAVLQATGLVNTPQQNLQRLRDHARAARAHGAELLVTPELFSTGYAPTLVHGTDGSLHREHLAAVAAENGLAVVGSTVEHHDGRHYISASLFNRAGAESTRYRKQHLFGPAEKRSFTPGSEPPAVVELHGVKLSLGICFDIEFPEFARAAALAGAELLCIPTAVPLRTGSGLGNGDGGNSGAEGGDGGANPFDTRLIPSMVVPTRALESQLFIAYANHAGPQFAGLSTLADPYGRRLVAAGGEEQLIIADVELATLDQARRDTDYLARFTDRTPLAITNHEGHQ